MAKESILLDISAANLFYIGCVMSNCLNKLDMQVWRTKGARFNAYRRLLRKHYASVFTISILSLYNIGLNLVPYSSFQNISSANDLSVSSIFISIFILILSLLEFSKGYELKSERLHNNAMELSQFYSELKIAQAENQKLTVELTEKYHRIIKSCPENHSPQDDNKFKTEHPHVFDLQYNIPLNKWIQKLLHRNSIKVNKFWVTWRHALLYHIDTYWLYLALIASPLVLYLEA